RRRRIRIGTDVDVDDPILRIGADGDGHVEPDGDVLRRRRRSRNRGGRARVALDGDDARADRRPVALAGDDEARVEAGYVEVARVVQVEIDVDRADAIRGRRRIAGALPDAHRAGAGRGRRTEQAGERTGAVVDLLDDDLCRSEERFGGAAEIDVGGAAPEVIGGGPIRGVGSADHEVVEAVTVDVA